MAARRHTVLVVEDEPVIRFDICHHLMECGLDVIEAASTQEAISLMMRNRGIDILFTDVVLVGNADGVDLANWALKNFPRMAVLITSGHESRLTGVRELCRENVFPKPYSLTAVSERIWSLMEARKPS